MKNFIFKTILLFFIFFSCNEENIIDNKTDNIVSLSSIPRYVYIYETGGDTPGKGDDDNKPTGSLFSSKSKKIKKASIMTTPGPRFSILNGTLANGQGVINIMGNRASSSATRGSITGVGLSIRPIFRNGVLNYLYGNPTAYRLSPLTFSEAGSRNTINIQNIIDNMDEESIINTTNLGGTLVGYRLQLFREPESNNYTTDDNTYDLNYTRDEHRRLLDKHAANTHFLTATYDIKTNELTINSNRVFENSIFVRVSVNTIYRSVNTPRFKEQIPLVYAPIFSAGVTRETYKLPVVPVATKDQDGKTFILNDIKVSMLPSLNYDVIRL